jgi:hypothetical protein
VSMMVRAWHWCESCESPSWFHKYFGKHDGYAYYFCKECDLEKYSMENDDYSEGEHENAVPLKIECVEVTA